MKFLSPRVPLYLYKCIIRPCMEYCYHVWAGAPSCYLEYLDKLQKWICRSAGPLLAASLEPLAHRRNVASLSLFYRYYFGRCSSELAQLFRLPFVSLAWSEFQLKNAIRVPINRNYTCAAKFVRGERWKYSKIESYHSLNLFVRRKRSMTEKLEKQPQAVFC